MSRGFEVSMRIININELNFWAFKLKDRVLKSLDFASLFLQSEFLLLCHIFEFLYQMQILADCKLILLHLICCRLHARV